MSTRYSQRGVSLIELIMFIVIVSVALAGILLVMNVTTRGSADPLIHKQSLAIAESLLEEAELMPFTYCDPDDPNAGAAASPADCTGGAGGPNDEDTPGPEGAGSVGGTEGRYAAPQFDNVGDYHNFSMSGPNGIRDITNSSVSSLLDGYRADVAVRASALPDVGANDALLVTVTVTGPDGLPVVVEGMRTRYSPRSLP